MNKLKELENLFSNILKDTNNNLDQTIYLNKFINQTNKIIKQYKDDSNIKDLDLKVINTPKNIIVGYMGVEGAFAYEASSKLFKNIPLKQYNTFKDVFEAIKNDEITYGVLPIENSSTGSINDNYDLIREYGFYIILDTNIKVNQNLLGIKGSKLADIKIVYSHPQALMQSKSFLKEHNIISRTYSNTAASAKYIKELNDKSIGSICSKSCAKLYDLDILAQNINESSTNTTRFLVISKNLEIRENAKQISIIFNLKHEIGSLSQILEDIKDYNLNMTRIESRPIKDKPFEYYFYIDFLGNIKSPNVIRALTKIKEDTINLKIIGNY